MNLHAYGIGLFAESDIHRRAALVVFGIQLGPMIGQELHDVVGSTARRGM